MSEQSGPPAPAIKTDPDSIILDSTEPATTISRPAPSHISTLNSYVAHTFHRSDAPEPSIVPADRTIGGDVQFMEIRSVLQTAAAAAPASSGREEHFTTSFRDIGVKLKACNDTLGELHQLGVSHAVSLPALVLVGDQSAGKSSLLSGLADIELPRSEGQCTRCPIHIRLSRNSQWSCRVWLQRDWRIRSSSSSSSNSASGNSQQPITEIRVTDQDKFPPWRRCERKQLDFKTIYDKREIDSVLRWAQVAILDDRDDVRGYVPGNDGTVPNATTLEEAARGTKTKFSPNVVSLDISGPDLPDLSFFDMPGIFQSAERDEDQYLTKVVEYLTCEYVGNTDAIIMCAMPMNQDPENSCTFNILRQMNATGRMIGVLTKADLLSKADPDRWLRILDGESYGAGLGYFVTSRPTNRPLDELKQWEDNFFEPNTSYELDWPRQFHRYRERCSVERLKLFLSKKLGEEFARRLPEIKDKVQHRLRSVEEQIACLPELPANVEHEVKMSLRRFEDLSRQRLRSNDFNSVYKAVPRAFLDTLLLMKPTFILKHSSDQPVIEIPDSDDEEDVVSPATASAAATPSKRARQAATTTTSAKRRQGANGVVPVVVSSAATSAATTPTTSAKHEARDGSVTPSGRTRGFALASTAGTANTPRRNAWPEPFAGLSFRKSTYHLSDLRRLIAQEATVPNVINGTVYERLCTEVVREWDKPMARFLQVAVDLMEDAVVGGKGLIRGTSALEQAMGSLQSRLIYRESARMLRHLFAQKRDETAALLGVLYSLEVQYPFTVNDAAMKRHQAEQGEDLRAYRHHMRWEAFNDTGLGGLGTLNTFVQPSMMQEDARRRYESVRTQQAARMGPDRFAQELDVASYVRGYYMHAAQRFGDTVALAINNRLVPELSRGLGEFLEDNLTRDDDDGGGESLFARRDVFSRLMEEDAETARRRESLKADRVRFHRALDSIRALEAQEGAAAVEEGSRAEIDGGMDDEDEGF